ncbi:TetR/AcrR family transcriptional regulator [Tengunoibacter tsumagoiensis]|uniref:TetR family transcriptional regulator n=1 Tax=Tengunoibacter tsumagoiensis TaxID=2014871 RepID=A0A402A4H5_9CHLR|nr:TetR/AcrR family transcriptional regulator [Tengunoibacter tsumagoiensis]GCE14043.1 TetR family transcriptional regulator [Tengunoibacter tsumagoiensis]
MKKSSARERRSLKVKEAILQAARELVIERGPDGISLREIARRIDYSPSGIYEYFGSVHEIIAAVSEEGSALLQAAFTRITVQQPVTERLVELGMAYLAFAEQYPDYFLLIFTRQQTLSEDVGKETQREAPYDTLRSAVQAGITDGTFIVRPDYDLDLMTYHCWVTVHGMAMLRLTLLKDSQDDFLTIHRRVLEQLIHSFTRPR